MTALLKVLEVATEGIHVVDEHGVTVVYNKAASEFDGLLPEEVLGKHILEVFPSLSHDSSTLLRVLKTGVPEIAKQQTFTNYKGKTITTINSTYPITDGDTIIGACEISTDITRIKEMAERIADLSQELRSKEHAEKPGVTRAKSKISRKFFTVDDIVGQSAVMRDVKRQVVQVARTQSNVLVWGETGTGKELVVQAIHSASDRADAPFVAQNCAALPEGLLEGLVFGTSKGGFTGAQDRPGLLELASGGTLYLDEIDSMPLGLQAKLLRVIQDKRVRRIGDVRERPVDVRIIGSTSMPPRQAVEQGLLRPDLYFRLAVVEIGLPPLRKRQEDIPLLVSHFLRKHGRGKTISVSPEVMSAFLTYDWPGNVRELEHAIEGSLAFLKGDTIEPAHIPPTVRGITATTGLNKGSIRSLLKNHEKTAIEEALRQGGSVSQAARILGIPRQTLQYRMKIHGIKSPRSRDKG
ncbi:MAG: sigma-54 interaction domain-containing protein [Bacillota bacterium]